MKMKLLSVAALLAAGAVAMPAVAGVTLDNVKKRGHVLCGVNTSAPGFSSADSQGKWRGLDVNICRSVAAAVLGDADKAQQWIKNGAQPTDTVKALLKKNGVL